MQNKKFQTITTIYFIALLMLIGVFVLSYMRIIQNEWVSTLLIQVVIISGIPTLMYTLFVSKNIKTTMRDFGFKKTPWKTILLAVLLGFVIYFLNIFVSSFFQSILYTIGFEDYMVTPIISIDPMASEILLVAMLPGLCEEILHRGLLLRGLDNATNKRFALIMSSLFFGLLHLDITKFFYATILGFLIGLVSLASDSIYPAIIMHFMNNFLSVYFSYASVKNLPLGNLRNIVIDFVFGGTSAMGTIIMLMLALGLLIMAYFYLLRAIVHTRLKFISNNLFNELKMEHLSPEQFNENMNAITKVPSMTQKNTPLIDLRKQKLNVSFVDSVFFIGTLVISILGTVITFIWGIL